MRSGPPGARCTWRAQCLDEGQHGNPTKLGALTSGSIKMRWLTRCLHSVETHSNTSFISSGCCAAPVRLMAAFSGVKGRLQGRNAGPSQRGHITNQSRAFPGSIKYKESAHLARLADHGHAEGCVYRQGKLQDHNTSPVKTYRQLAKSFCTYELELMGKALEPSRGLVACLPLKILSSRATPDKVDGAAVTVALGSCRWNLLLCPGHSCL